MTKMNSWEYDYLSLKKKKLSFEQVGKIVLKKVMYVVLLFLEYNIILRFNDYII